MEPASIATFSSPTSGQQWISVPSYLGMCVRVDRPGSVMLLSLWHLPLLFPYCRVLGSTIIGAWGVFSVWALSPTAITVYMLSWTVYFFFHALSVPSFAYAARYILDFVLLYVADCLRSKLVRQCAFVAAAAAQWCLPAVATTQVPSWFAAQQFQ